MNYFRPPSEALDAMQDQVINLARAADVLGIGKTELKRRIQSGIYHNSFVVDDKKRHWFGISALEAITGESLAELRADLEHEEASRTELLKRKKQKKNRLATEVPREMKATKQSRQVAVTRGTEIYAANRLDYNASQFRAVAAKLKAGEQLIDIVTNAEIDITPTQFKAIVQAYCEIAGAFMVSLEAARAISPAIVDAKTLLETVANLREAAITARTHESALRAELAKLTEENTPKKESA